mmetsp:Transcript_16352/g.24954  ORF Transcript_16352/g.24954 Transcript_16352/m.24954 type:complete len:83 (+) Transcript_16352:242-490(+)
MCCCPQKCISNDAIHGQSPFGSITVKIEWNHLPKDSHMVGFWRVTILKASNLIAFDVQTKSSDPFCLVQACDRKEKSRSNRI